MASPIMVNARSPVPVQADRMARIEERLIRLDAQISSGERFTEPAEDPAGATRAALLARLDLRLQSEDRAVQRGSARLALAETALDRAGEVLLRARDLALLAATATTSDADRAVIGGELDALEAQLLDAANARDEAGRRLFAGAAGEAPAYTRDAAGRIVWQGFGQAAGAESAGLPVGSAPRGPAVFGTDETGAFARLAAMRDALRQTDPVLRAPALAAAITGLDDAHGRVSLGQARLGADMARLESEANRIAGARLDTAEALAATNGLDLTAAIAQMQALQLTLSAAQASFARLYQDSLFDRLG